MTAQPAHRCALCAGLTVVMLMVCMTAPSPAGAQEAVRGQVVDGATGVPVGAGFVVLLGPGGEEIGRTLTDRDGRFLFPLAPSQAGPLRVRSERIGYRMSLSEPIEVSGGAMAEITLRVGALPTPLSQIEVQGTTECRVRPDEGERTAVVWEEARKALAAASWTASRGRFHTTSNVYDRDLDGRRRVIQERHRPSIGVSSNPFVSKDPSALVSDGYAVAERWGVAYFAPDAQVLQDDGFLDTHCFSLRRPEGGSDELIGLAFVPVPSRDLPDVEGVLWVHRASSELRTIEYRYTNLPAELRTDDPGGGTIEFASLPDGTWIVNRWHIAIPTAVSDEPVDRFDRLPRRRADAYRNTGGEVLSVTDSTGATVYEAEQARLVGRVIGDEAGGSLPISGATVSVDGTWFEGVTDRDGWFALSAPLDGAYGLTLSHARTDTLGVTLPAGAVDLARGRTDTLAISFPGDGEVRRRLCDDDGAGGSDYRIVVGTVRDSATGSPVRGAQIVAAWQRILENLDFRNVEGSATADLNGRYVLCGLEYDRPALVYGTGRRGRSDVVRVLFGPWGVDIGAAYHETIAGVGLVDLTLRGGAESLTLMAGSVTDAESGTALPGAMVAVEGLAAAVTDSSGVFRLDGVSPGRRRIEVRRLGYRSRSGWIDVEAEGPTILGAEFLALTPAVQVVGAVRGLGTGDPVSQAWVTLRSAAGDSVVMTLSDSLGRFVLTAPEPGSYLVTARRLGYAPRVEGPFDIQRGTALEFDIGMRWLAFTLDPLEVTAEAVDRYLTDVGFYARQVANRGYFLDREMIEKRMGPSADVAQLLTGLPGVMVGEGGLGTIGTSLSFGRQTFDAGCAGPRIYVNGFVIENEPVGGGLTQPQFVGLSQVVRPEDVYAIEVYRTPSQIPAQFGGAESGCGVMLIWSR